MEVSKTYLTPFNDLEKLVAKMRELGIKEYKSGDVHVILDGKPSKELDEVDQEAQQRIRDEREKKFLEAKRNTLYRAAWGIGKPRESIK